jgi:pimeloyl-ACP methyl ester carboxylesterase
MSFFALQFILRCAVTVAAIMFILFVWLWWIFTFLLKLILWILSLIVVGVWYLQGSLLFMPNYQGRSEEKRGVQHNDEGYRSPEDYELEFEDLYIKTRDRTMIHAWLLKVDGRDAAAAPTIVFFHGNAGNIGFRLPNARQLIRKTGCNVMLVEYRGYGNSDGQPSELGLVMDAQASVEYLVARNDLSRNIFLFGRSLGGAVAVECAFRNREVVSGVIVENTFSSLTDVVLTLFQKLKVTRCHGLLRPFLNVFLTSKWDTISKMRRLTCPVFFVSGAKDELIPPAQMARLHGSATASRDVDILIVKDGTHNDTYVKGGQQYYDRMKAFVVRNSSR